MGTLTGKGLIKFRLEYLNVLVINFFPHYTACIKAYVKVVLNLINGGLGLELNFKSALKSSAVYL